LKTILHLLSSNKLSGAENVVIDIIRNLGNSFKIYYSSPKGSIGEVLAEKKISYVPIDRMTPLAVSKLVKKLKPDIIHAHDYRASIIGAIVKEDAKLISHLHNNYIWARRYNAKTLLFSIFINRMDSIVVVSKSVLEENIYYKKMLPKTVVIQNCIDLQKIYNIQNPKKDRNIDVVFVGRLTEQKDPLAFITCIDILKNEGIKLKAGIVGDGELENSCIREIQRLGLENEIIMHGFQPNPYKFMADSKVIILPSKWEGFGLVTMEAMSLGVPVVCTGVGGLKEFVVDGENGFVCRGIDELAGAVKKLLTDNELWEHMSCNAINTARTWNDLRIYINKIKGLY